MISRFNVFEFRPNEHLMPSIRILIADDHDLIRAGLKATFRGTEIEVVAEAATGEAAVELARDAEPDLALLDIRMPRGDGSGINPAF